MVRIVRTPSGRMEVDFTGKKPGRGAYLCKASSCWEMGLKRNSLGHALKATLGADERREMTEFARQFSDAGEGTSIGPGGDGVP